MLASSINLEIVGEEDFKKSVAVKQETPFRDNLNRTLTFDNFVVGSSQSHGTKCSSISIY